MGLIDDIKRDAQKSGGSKGKFFYVKDGDSRRVRFLVNIDQGFTIPFHDSFEANINVPCQKVFGRECPYCGEEGLRTRNQYMWSVWDYDAKEVKALMYPMNNCSPVGAIASSAEVYDSLKERDFVIKRIGKQQATQYSVLPMDKNAFTNSKAKPLSKKAFLEMLDAAYPDELSQDGTIKPKSEQKKGKKKEVDIEELDWTTPSDRIDYSTMSARELYNLCEEREIEAEPKMKPKYYIDLLEEYDEEHNSDAADEEDDDWGDDDGDGDDTPDYSSMSAKELYKLCEDRGIEAKPKKPEKYYIKLLEDADKANDDWGDTDDDDDDWE